MIGPIPDAVAAVLAVAGQVADDGPLRAAVAGWSEAPWRIAVVGRTAVGKSTLINARLGRKALRTGLGGVTRVPAEVIDANGSIWIDTPGLDGPDRDLGTGLFEGVDEVVWVVDGLQPMTASEREALAQACGLPLHVVVSRADRIEPAELPSVLERVRALAAPWAPITVRAVDLRAAERHDAFELADLSTPAPWLSPRRTEALRNALVGLQAAVAALPPLPDRDALADALVARWRTAVREVTGPIEVAIRAGRIEHRAAALRWLLAAAIPARKAFEGRAATAIAPLVPTRDLVLPEPEADEHRLVDVAGGLGGAGAALREITRVAARWLLDGEIALRDWVTAATWDAGPAAARAAVEGTIPRALVALGSGVGPIRPSC